MLASNLVDTAPGLTVAAYCTGTTLAAENADLTKRFPEAVNESLLRNRPPGRGRAVVDTYTQISETARLTMISPNWPGEINRSSLEVLSGLGQEDGTFARPPALDKILP